MSPSKIKPIRTLYTLIKFMLIVILVLLLVCVSGVLLMNYFGFAGMITATDVLHQIKPILSGVRMSLFMAVYFYWDAIAGYLEKKYLWNKDNLTKVSAHKHSILLFVIVVEVVLVNNIPKSIIKALSG